MVTGRKAGLNLISDQPRQVDPTLLKVIEDCCQPDRMNRPESMKIV